MNELDRTETVVSLFVNASVNGCNFSVEGKAQGRTGAGQISAFARSRDELPAGFRLGLLPYVLITGQPSLSKNLPGADNPFVRTNGEYEAVRTLDLGSFGALRSEYSVSRSNAGGLTARFETTGTVNVPELRRILPTVETWLPIRRGEQRGSFPLVWETHAGDLINGRADTEYKLPYGECVDEVTYRYICIDMTDEGSELRQYERIVVYSEGRLSAAMSVRAETL